MRVGEAWFDEPWLGGHIDLLYRYQASAATPGSLCEPKSTIDIDLTCASSERWTALKKDCRNEVRRAERDGCVAHVLSDPDASVLRDFLTFYTGFAVAKGIPDASRCQLVRYRRFSSLLLSVVKAPDGTELAWHAYVLRNGRARLLHSASLADPERRAATGRANRQLHWADMEWLADRKVARYDFGGWYRGASDEALLKVNKFKEEFGGAVVAQFNCVTAQSVIGRLALAMLRRRRRAPRGVEDAGNDAARSPLHDGER